MTSVGIIGHWYKNWQTSGQQLKFCFDPGSSGSPVFNQKWQLVALHHASSTKKEANEGIRIDVIIDAIKAEALSK